MEYIAMYGVSCVIVGAVGKADEPQLSIEESG